MMENRNNDAKIFGENLYKGAVVDSAASSYEMNVTQSLITSGTFTAPHLFWPVPGVGIPGDMKVNSDSWSERILSDNKEEYLRLIDRENLLQKFKNGIHSMAIEYMVNDIDGNPVWLHQSIHLSQDPHNGDVLALIVIVDKTEEKLTAVQNERRMLVIEGLTAEYETVCWVDLTHDNYEVYRLSGKLSKAFGDVLKPSFEESIHLLADRVVYAADRERFLEHLSIKTLQKVLEQKQETSFTFRGGVMGEPLYYRAKLVPIHDGLGELTRILIGFANIQEERANDGRRQLVLETALEQARQASAAKNTFLSRMSHDIRTPMNAIIGLSEIAEAHPDDPEKVEDCLKKIRFAGIHLLELIDNVLDMSRIESGRSVFREEACSIRELIRSVTELFQPSLRRKKQTLTLNAEKDVADMLILDKVRMTQLISNLLSNAVKYTPDEGQIRIDIHNRKNAPEGYQGILLHVIDNGIGMSNEFQNHVFEPFEREQNSDVISQNGTGLGTSICKGIVEAMGGTISVWSSEGTGTVFTISLDLKIADHESAGRNKADSGRASILARGTVFGLSEKELLMRETGQKEKTASDVKPKGNYFDRPLQLLLVEDNELNREITTELLKSKGYLVESAENGRQALAMIMQRERYYYDAVLMDIQMPEMDGYETTRAIRLIEKPEDRKLPIIALTANVYSESIQRAKEAGMNACISKPVETGALAELLNEVLDSSQKGEEA
ncbi:MAG: ATP-binding protein [Lachnospiraceae bacterium]|nr:ATP-binding protein [Lachnospiraceae bacterium]